MGLDKQGEQGAGLLELQKEQSEKIPRLLLVLSRNRNTSLSPLEDWSQHAVFLSNLLFIRSLCIGEHTVKSQCYSPDLSLPLPPRHRPNPGATTGWRSAQAVSLLYPSLVVDPPGSRESGAARLLLFPAGLRARVPPVHLLTPPSPPERHAQVARVIRPPKEARAG